MPWPTPGQATVSTETPAAVSAFSAVAIESKGTVASSVPWTRSDQPPGIADDAGELTLAPRSDKQRHHRALREPDQRELGLGQIALLELVVDKGVEDRRRGAGAGEPRLGVRIANAHPLVTRPHVAGEWRVGRQELGVGQQRSPRGRQPDKIVAVGAEPVQQDHQLAGLRARLRRIGRPGQGLRHCRGLRRGRGTGIADDGQGDQRT
jgi:hypothetical protein